MQQPSYGKESNVAMLLTLFVTLIEMTALISELPDTVFTLLYSYIYINLKLFLWVLKY